MVIPCQELKRCYMKKIKKENIQPYYFVDEFGQIYSNYRNKLKKLKYSVDKDGYFNVSLQLKNGKRNSFRVNRLVALTYLDNPHNFPVVNHKDNNKQNNKVDNLEWCSISYNTSEGYKNKNYHYKRKVKSIHLITKEEKIFNSVKECADFFKITYYDVSKIANGKDKIRKSGKIAFLNFIFID